MTGKRDDARAGVGGMVGLAGGSAALTGSLGGLYVHEPPDSPGVRRSGELGARVPSATISRIVNEEFFLDEPATLLPSRTQPWLFVVPGDDGAEPPDHQRAGAELFPDHRIVLLEGRGHMVPQERPALVAEAVRRFVGSSAVSDLASRSRRGEAVMRRGAFADEAVMR